MNAENKITPFKKKVRGNEIRVMPNFVEGLFMGKFSK